MSSTLGITTVPAVAIKEKIGLFAYRNNPTSLSGIQTLTFDCTTNVQGWNFEGCPDLTSVVFTNLATCRTISFSACPLLANFSMPNFLPPNNCTINLANNALPSATVNQILHQCVASAAFVSGLVRFDGGTNGAPSGQGIIDKATLIGRGVTVITN